MPEIRKWHVDRALHSVRSLFDVIDEMTLDEVLAALELESASRRRRAIMTRLVGKAARLNEQQFLKQLNKRYKYAAST